MKRTHSLSDPFSRLRKIHNKYRNKHGEKFFIKKIQSDINMLTSEINKTKISKNEISKGLSAYIDVIPAKRGLFGFVGTRGNFTTKER